MFVSIVTIINNKEAINDTLFTNWLEIINKSNLFIPKPIKTFQKYIIYFVQLYRIHISQVVPTYGLCIYDVE